MVSVDIAVNLAAITFNHRLEGLSPLFEQVIGSPPSHLQPTIYHLRMIKDL